jgi:cytosol aminopeptidase
MIRKNAPFTTSLSKLNNNQDNESDEDFAEVPHHGFVCGYEKSASGFQLTMGGHHFDKTIGKATISASMNQLPFKHHRMHVVGHQSMSLFKREDNQPIEQEQPYLVAATHFKQSKSDDQSKSEDNQHIDPHQIMTIVGKGVRGLQEHRVNHIWVDPCHLHDAEAASIGAHLACFAYDALKSEREQVCKPSLYCYEGHSDHTESLRKSWEVGRIKAEAQNLARKLMDMPSNHLTPQRYAEIAKDVLSDKVNVQIHSLDWIKKERMNTFLAVAQGSKEPPVFVEMELQIPGQGPPSDTTDIALVGKGITFDSGGISIKPSADMDLMRADMGGAAVCLSVLYALSRLYQLEEFRQKQERPMRIVACIPLCENMPGGGAIKPGDVVQSRSGLSLQIDDTDAEGRMILCDALHYVTEKYQPQLTVDVATLTGAMAVALGNSCTGAFSHPIPNEFSSSSLWSNGMTLPMINEMQKLLCQVSYECGDPVWPMPIAPSHVAAMKNSPLADLNNIVQGGSRYGGACTAAGFLSNFVNKKRDWLHLDMAGVMTTDSTHPYMRKGMSGRPVRALTEMILHLASGKKKQE